MLEVIGLSAGYQGNDVVHNVAFRVNKGEAVVRDAGQSERNLPNRDQRRAGQSIKEFA